jgi:2,4-didehydro-3-deoxy-L-rhamnonate hydrolase
LRSSADASDPFRAARQRKTRSVAGGETQGFVGVLSGLELDFFAESGLERLSALLKADEARSLPEVSEGDRWGSPVARPGKIVCVGLNFSDHAKESGMPVPTEPVLFLKTTNTVVGSFDDILIPRNGNKTDWEVERLNSA